MNIVVFIKQVPDTTDVKWTKDNNIDRTQMESIMNPVDKQAVELALNLKEQFNAKIIAITMGPNKAIEVLKEAIAMGVDDAVLLCDPKFAGSDTCATSKVLSSVIKEKFPETNLILFGQSAIDGETSQTGTSTAVRLNMPFISHVKEIIGIEENIVTVNSETETEKKTYKVNLPAVLCVNNYVLPPRIPRINGYIKAQDYNYKTYNLYELNLMDNETGVKGSPTYVSKVYKTNDTRSCELMESDYEYSVITTIKEVMKNG
ncbi:MAG: electron transfer flavoprotein subunit beta/FixA family protein [Candidatus Gastranaerophilales bacterium]|nr:electron transfer flavoprotein subunit beta/FixA family protein [Candidatus Gastranaerophilales bacterium]